MFYLSTLWYSIPAKNKTFLRD